MVVGGLERQDIKDEEEGVRDELTLTEIFGKSYLIDKMRKWSCIDSVGGKKL